MVARLQLKAFVKAISLIMFFITFFSSYIFYSYEITEALIKGLITMFVTGVVVNTLFMVWRFAYSSHEWKTIVDGKRPPKQEVEAIDNAHPTSDIALDT